ncbi:hypothetical protein [uncultured Jannaschia sp.]|uniref:hypothetical protein n=1 Tax=uncultured Jannaschia sp. TaxID=293347 RepID=UPI00262FFC97|nr:hypothetical protein [uncultured Jannaschia sp.]
MRHSLIALALASGVSAASAAELPEPTGPVVLVVTGEIANTNMGDEAHFDLAMLDALASRETVIETPWYEGTKAFSGPMIAALLDAVGAEGETLRVNALNDYSAEIPRSDVVDYPVILATRIDGDTLSVRDKGPGFVIYPFDVAPDLYNEMTFGRSVWQVGSIDVF